MAQSSNPRLPSETHLHLIELVAVLVNRQWESSRLLTNLCTIQDICSALLDFFVVSKFEAQLSGEIVGPLHAVIRDMVFSLPSLSSEIPPFASELRTSND